MAELDPAVVKRTQESLGKFVKKPPLTEKLLKKPPFRFLHDVFNVVIKDTGCFEGLYTPDELDFENIKDRDDKMRFLQKMIDVIKITTNTPITVRTSKIVAGQEPEKTNELLQLMGAVIGKKLDWKSAVEKVRKDGKGQEKEKTHTKLKSQEKPKDKSTDKTKDKEQKTTTKDGRIRETKGSTKTISPTTKTEKPKKPMETKEKEKISRTTKDKTGKDLKEKAVKKSREATEKSKPAKSKGDLKEKSPSPVKVDVVKEENMEAAVVDNREKVESKEPGKPVKVDSEIREQGRTENATKLERRNSKILHEIQAQPPAEASVPDVSNAIEPKVEAFEVNEVRKSSAQRKGSSGKKRRSNASNAAKEERDRNAAQQPVTSSSNFESLNALKEEEAPQVTKAAAQPTPVPPQQHAQSPPAQPASPSAASGHHSSAELKRESTFTRENSKDSTGNATNRPRTSLRPPSARPASARPGAPRRRDKNVEIVLQPNDPVKMSGINVKLETFGDLDDDGENLVIIEDVNAANITAAGEEVRSEVSAENNLEQQGHLVQQILETQKELMQQNGGNGSGKNEKENDAGSALSGRQSSARQMNNLRDIIQNLTKSVNPFGKLMDFIPEDIDAMQLEMTMWRDSYTQAANELRREKSLTESATEPMKNQLVQIEASIKEYLEMVDASRTKILQNSEKILKMLMEQ